MTDAKELLMRKSNRSHRRGGFTLLEIMVATAVTLLMMISLVQIFKIIGDSMKQGRAALQINNTLRSITHRLRQDLSNVTVRVDPPADPSTGAGYFKIVDGSMTDYTSMLFDQGNYTDTKLPTQAVRSNRFGDLDDILQFTARAGDAWFVGRVPENIMDSTIGSTGSITITSQLAEITVFARPVNTSGAAGVFFDDTDANFLPDAYRLHYRALLIRPDLNRGTFNGQPCLLNVTAGTSNQAARPLDTAPAFQICDLSMHRVYDGDAATIDAMQPTVSKT